MNSWHTRYGRAERLATRSRLFHMGFGVMTNAVEDPDLEAALAAGIPEIYANSFANYMSDSDILTVLQRNGRPVGMINMSLPVAKAYAKFVLDLVSNHEQVAGYTLKLPLTVELEDGRTD